MKMYTFAASVVGALVVSPASSSLLNPEYSLPRLDMDKKIRANHANRVNVLRKMQSVVSRPLRKLEEEDEVDDNFVNTYDDDGSPNGPPEEEDDDGGPNGPPEDDDFDDGPDYSLQCSFSWSQSIFQNTDLIDLEPQGVLDEETGIFDYAADQNAFDAYDSYCNILGGQTLSFDFDFSDECNVGLDKMINLPFCFGSACDEEDIAILGNSISDLLTTEGDEEGDDDAPSCTASFTVESDGDGEFGPPGIQKECLDDMFNIYFSEDVFGEEFEKVLAGGDGYAEALANFEESCENESGRIVIASSAVTPNISEECSDESFTSKPFCVAKNCDNEEATLVTEFIFGEEDGDCGKVTFTIDEEDENGSKSSKSNKKKKATKKAKGTKSGKQPKVAKHQRQGNIFEGFRK